ncbi:fatty acyl-CoA reductase wat-like [Spodoptera litura]|uniref:Fatty acyl-CoA reductase n=1 Tax=Spodoptera litura TaxID=69820 RepID=A0A9J7EWS2_SPOLT|nr:fatty acyl-CoA reductase wat-like [Spodoptera litura]
MAEIDTMDPAQEYLETMLSRHKKMDDLTERGDSAVQQFYQDAVVFVTGGTGFLGKQLIEKLIRSTKLSKVYVVLRPKKSNSVEERLRELLKEPVFDKLRKQQPEFAEKIIPVAGDVSELNLGISYQEWNIMADEVNVIFHLAATTRFDASIRESTMINIRGTKETLRFGKQCKNLKSYVHVSTAYANACHSRINSQVLEDFYPPPVEPDMMIELIDSMEEERLNNITPGLIENWPNTYCFTKAVAEEAVRALSGDLPICVVKPSLVIGALNEPQPGWIDVSAVYGITGVSIGVGLGLMHTSMTNGKVHLGLIPVDYVNNAIIVAAWETGKRKSTKDKKPKVYTVVSTTRSPKKWSDLSKLLKELTVWKYPTPMSMGYSLYLQTRIPFLYWVYSWLFHMIPAYIADGICSVLGRQRRFVKLYTKMTRLMVTLSYFTLNDWHFADNNTEALYDNLSAADKEIFSFNIDRLNWTEFMSSFVIGVRQYILKDGLVNTKYAIKKVKVLRLLTYIGTAIYLYLLYKIVCYSYSSLTFAVGKVF